MNENQQQCEIYNNVNPADRVVSPYEYVRVCVYVDIVVMSTGMTTRCQLALQKSQQELIRDLDIKPVTDCLLAKLILTREDCKRILAIHSDHDKRRLLLDLLPHRGQQAFDVLSEFLASPTNQPWLHHTLHENLERITQGNNCIN